MDVGAWLRGLGVGQYEQSFRDNDIDARVLPGLTADDLKEIGVSSVGHRRLLLQAAAALPIAAAPPAPAARASEAVGASDAHTSPQAERRQLTVMFVDLVGSTALSARLDPEEMRAVLLAYQNAVAGEVARYRGHVAHLMGDGVLAYFGWPAAREDMAERAVRAGLAVTQAVADLSLPIDERLACRVGIATGLVVVGDLVGEGTSQEAAVVGETPNLAARLQAAAGPGQVVIAEGTRRLVGDLFELAGPESRTLKGLAGPVPSWRVAGEHPGISRFEARRGGRWTPLVGRDQELALLLDRWDLARGGEGQAVLLCGEPGIGKSRLAAATAEALDGQEHTVLRYQCSPQYSGSSLWPVCQQLAAAARLDRAAASSEQLFRLEELLRRGVPEPGDAPRLLGELLGIPIDDPLPDLTAQQKRGRVLAALVDQLLGLGRRMPVLVLFEDVHWIDPTSLELVERTLEAIGATRVLFVMTCRPDNQPPFGGHPHLTRVTLNRLGRAAAEAIVTRLVADRALSGLVRDRILAQTDGVPLFIEELTKAVLEAGVEGMTVPASLHDLLMARLDRSADVRHVAQAAACIGREFDHGLLASVVDMPDLDAAMGELVRAELVFRRGTPPAASYSFKHALVRDAAHHSLLKSRRRELHERVARALEGRPDAVGAPEIVAHHLSEAEIADDAVGWWLVAGRRAIGHSAYVEAARHLERGLADAARLAVGPSRTDRELELYAALGNALIFAKGFAAPETAWAFAEARRRCGQLDDTRQIAAILYGGWVVHVVRAEHEAAYRVATELSERLEGTSDPVALIIGHRLLGVSSHFLGRTTDALDHFERLLALRVPADDGDPIGTHAYDPYVVALSFSSHSLLQLGQFGEAQQRIRAALARARELAHPATVAFALWGRAFSPASVGRTPGRARRRGSFAR